MGNLSNFVKRVRDIMRNDAGINGDAQRIEQIAWMLFLKVYDAKEDDWEWNEKDYQSIIPEPCRWRSWAHDENGKGITGDTLLEFVNNTLFPTLKKLPVDASTPIKKAIVQTTFADANNYMKDGVLLRQVINVIDELDLSDYAESHAFGEIYETILKELQSAGSAGEFYTPRAVTDFMAQMINPQIGEKMADFACGTGGFITSWLKALHKKVKTTEMRRRRIVSAVCIAACFAVIVGVSFAMPGIIGRVEPGTSSGFETAATILGGSTALGYMVIGLLAFILGACVTILCFRIHQLNKEEQTEEQKGDNGDGADQ